MTTASSRPATPSQPTPDAVDDARAVLANGMAAGRPREAMRALIAYVEQHASWRPFFVEMASRLGFRDHGDYRPADVIGKLAEVLAENERLTSIEPWDVDLPCDVCGSEDTSRRAICCVCFERTAPDVNELLDDHPNTDPAKQRMRDAQDALLAGYAAEREAARVPAVAVAGLPDALCVACDKPGSAHGDPLCCVDVQHATYRPRRGAMPPTPAALAEPPAFKAGDRVRCVNAGMCRGSFCHGLEEGHVYEVHHVTPSVGLVLVGRENSGEVFADRFVLAADSVPASEPAGAAGGGRGPLPLSAEDRLTILERRVQTLETQLAVVGGSFV